VEYESRPKNFNLGGLEWQKKQIKTLGELLSGRIRIGETSLRTGKRIGKGGKLKRLERGRGGEIFRTTSIVEKRPYETGGIKSRLLSYRLRIVKKGLHGKNRKQHCKKGLLAGKNRRRKKRACAGILVGNSERVIPKGTASVRAKGGKKIITRKTKKKAKTSQSKAGKKNR